MTIDPEVLASAGNESEHSAEAEHQDPPRAAAAAEAEAEAEAKAPVDTAKVGIARQCVTKWMQDRIHNSPVSRATEAYNHLQSELENLVQAIVKEL